MESLLISVGIGLLWGGLLLAVNRVLGDRHARAFILLLIVVHVLLTMGAVYAPLSTDASLVPVAVTTMSILALDHLSNELD
ncbi:hypothetical protein [Natronorubrum halophilum]|uniref:hypothetical protein n=1 Tax=Natronorubrum halophilum TaxID=1702106 RepID=UPI000EF6F7A4|nr:hypothetical protein [Natronorubrum halophilum]